ncbi:potassium-transporting ATPase subunit KdpC [Pedococcus sp. KACC 23699]|uniref:Potassium-transporting ATPase KdpC subunit n=1 Tax=Pedococcus sp. KACC 23699 TaxID=3149228 RepID=A0AAU7JUK5_9MICO
MTSLTRQYAAALRLLLALTVLLGGVYPAVVYGVGRIGLSDQANGSLVERNGAVVGSSLLGQQFSGDRWFHGRPSVSDYSGDTSGGSNLAASSKDQVAAVTQRRAAVTAAEGRGATQGDGAIPADALTASASGLDPHISPAYAALQVPRVAKATGLGVGIVEKLVAAHTQGRTIGFLGEARVNVLELNLALARAVG